MPADVLSITVRNLGFDGLPLWEQTVYSWRKAWNIVDKAYWPRKRTKTYKLDQVSGLPSNRLYGQWIIDFTEGS